MVVQTEAVLKDEKVRKFLKDISVKVNKVEQPAKAVWGLLTARAYADVIDHFEKERGPKAKWKPIKRMGQILQDEGKLKNGITIATSTGLIKRGVLLQDKVEYALTHDMGLTVKKKKGGSFKMPMRKFFWLSQKAMDNMGKDVMKFLFGKAKP